MAKWNRRIRVVYRNHLFKWLFPLRECRLIVTDCGAEKRIILRPGQAWAPIKFRNIEAWRILDAIIFVVLVSK